MPDPTELLLKDLEKIQTQLMANIDKMIPRLAQLSDAELIRIAQEIDFFRELERLGAFDSLNGFLGAYDDKAEAIVALARDRGLKTLSTASVNSLEFLRDLDGATMLGRWQDFSNELKSELLKGLVAGVPSFELANTLREQIGDRLFSSKAGMIINDSYARFSNSATFKMFEDFPDQKYRYIGRRDDRNRDACATVLDNKKNEQGFTIDEIGSLPVDQATRGGFNCRHDWVPV